VDCSSTTSNDFRPHPGQVYVEAESPFITARIWRILGQFYVRNSAGQRVSSFPALNEFLSRVSGPEFTIAFTNEYRFSAKSTASAPRRAIAPDQATGGLSKRSLQADDCPEEEWASITWAWSLPRAKKGTGREFRAWAIFRIVVVVCPFMILAAVVRKLGFGCPFRRVTEHPPSLCFGGFRPCVVGSAGLCFQRFPIPPTWCRSRRRWV